MAPDTEDDCPVCHTPLSRIADGSDSAKESHIADCIESRLTAPTAPAPAGLHSKPQLQEEEREEGDSCAICHTSFLTKEFANNDPAREAHFSTCFESQASGSKSHGLPPSYDRKANFDTKNMSDKGKLAKPPPPNAVPKIGLTPVRSAPMPVEIYRTQKSLVIHTLERLILHVF